MVFQQAQIPVRKTEEFEQLRAAIERLFSRNAIDGLFRKLQASDVRVREFEKALEKSIFERSDPLLAQSGRSAKELFAALTLSDQALMREFYLERVEQVDAKIRQRFQKAYRYY